jgi:hypothetical protein
MITLCHAAKGGSGTTLVVAARATEAPGPTLIVDFEGDVPSVLGLAKPERPGVVDWLESDAPVEHLDDLLIEYAPTRALLPAWAGLASRRSLPTAQNRWSELADWLTGWAHNTGGEVIVDAGTSTVPVEFAERCPQRWLVMRSCYLALLHASTLTVRPTGIVLIAEPGRTLRRHDIERVAGAPVVATLDWDPRVARAVDAGLLLSRRLPAACHGPLARAGS